LKSKVKYTWNENVTRSQAVARIADRTALQQMLNFRENYLCACSAFPMPRTKFEASSSSSFRDIAL